MTNDNKHRTIRLPEGSRRIRLLQTHLIATTNAIRAERSRWVWGRITPDEPDYPRQLKGLAVQPDAFVLTPLSILHTLTGLTVETRRVEP